LKSFSVSIHKRTTISVLGSGAWGTAVGHMLASKAFIVTLWGKDPNNLLSIKKTQENKRYLPNYHLSEKLRLSGSLQQALKGANIVIISIPVQYMRSVVRKASKYFEPDAVIINLAKGIESKTFCRATEIIQQETTKKHPVAVLSGPNIASEIMKQLPSKAVISSNDVRYLPWLIEVFTTQFFFVYQNADLVGVEICGALKNIIAILAGVSDGLGYGSNTKSAVITGGLSEMMRFGVHFGASPNTFFGLAGIGDLIATCTSQESRNRRLGETLGKGRTLRQAMKTLHGRVAEGVETTRAIHGLKDQLSISMPYTELVYQILHAKNRDIHPLFNKIWSLI
jgi:glycerol-3-phosphate dehydrogenase (NAD(P)+)